MCKEVNHDQKLVDQIRLISNDNVLIRAENQNLKAQIQKLQESNQEYMRRLKSYSEKEHGIQSI